jgi:transcriptional regulator with GAF, ATPase, and Fis domain
VDIAQKGEFLVAPGRESQLITAFVELAETLVRDFDAADLFHNLVGHAVDVLHLEAAGLMLSDQRGTLQVVASSSERTRLLELLQLETNTGPCLECFQTGQPVSVPDLAAPPDRWPLFVERALRDTYAAVHALPLRLGDQVIGVLNLLATVAGELTSEELRLGRALADLATVGVVHDLADREPARVAEQVQRTLLGRLAIEQAKGLIAEAGSLDMDDAFARLRTYARSNRLRLAELSRQIVDGTVKAADVLTQGAVSPATSPSQRPPATRGRPPARNSTTGTSTTRS